MTAAPANDEPVGASAPPPAVPLRGPDAIRPVLGTPLVRSHLLDHVWWKVEGANVTGTFKDRVMHDLVADAIASGARAAVVASSGNAAVAAAFACRRAGLPLLALVPAATPEDKLRPLRLRGVPIVPLEGDPSAAYAVAADVTDRLDLAELPSTFRSPLTELACRAIGHEICAQLGEPPTAVSAAISVGPVLLGTGNGVAERTGVQPVLLGAQASGCAPIARAFEAGDDNVHPWPGPVTTSAGSIADRLQGYPEQGSVMARAARHSGGWIRAWPDTELNAARQDLAQVDGIDVELASAGALLAARDWSGPGPIVGVLTGDGSRETVSGASVPDGEGSLERFAEAARTPELMEVLNRWI